MLAIPSTGTTFNMAGFNDKGPEFLRRGTEVAVLARDARGAATDLSPHNSDGSLRWSPFAADNTWRGDLLGVKKLNGYYVTNTDPNEGFINLGRFKDGDGPAWNPKVTSDHFMTLQDRDPYDSIITEESEPFDITPVDTASPWIQRLRYNRPFSDVNGNSLLEDPGQKDAVFARLSNGVNPARQFLFIRERTWDGLPIYSVQVVTYAKLDDIGGSKYDKKDSEAAKLSFLPLPDGRTMAFQDGEYQPVKVYTIWGGAGWTALGGVPTLSSSAPVATAGGTAGEATVALADPTGVGDPWTYTAQQSTDGGSTFGTAIDPDSVASSGGTTTVSLSGLTSGASVLRVTVQGTNGATATTPNSNSITVL